MNAAVTKRDYLINNEESSNERIVQLDSIRFFMCMIVVVSHCIAAFSNVHGQGLLETFFSSSAFALDYFFILSGFGMMLSYEKNVLHKKGLRFAWEHIKKIYPTYIFAMLLILPFSLKHIKNYLLWFTVDSSLLQSVSCNLGISHSINGVNWFLSTLFVIYLFSPFLLYVTYKILSNKHWFLLTVFVICMLICSLIIDDWFRANNISIQVWKLKYDINAFGGSPFGPPLWKVILGMIVGGIYVQNKEHINYKKTIDIWITTIVLFWIYFRNRCLFLGGMLLPVFEIVDILLCMCLIYFIATSKGILTNILSKKNFIILGKSAMYIYLIHYPVIEIVKRITSPMAGNVVIYSNWILEIVITVLLVSFMMWIDNIRKNKTIELS